MLEKYISCQKSYLHKILYMLYDSNGFKPYIYIYMFFKACPCATHISILLALCQNPLNIIFWAVSKVFGTAEAVFTRHVRPMDRTYLASRTCPAPGPDMSTYRVSSLYKGAAHPLRTIVFPLHLFRRPRAL
jgi:hypothetical protein